jgi:signal transduction histidine kinase
MRALCLLLALSWSCCLAQDDVNEVNKKILAEKDDSLRINLLLQAAWNFKYSQPNVSHRYLDDAIELSRSGSKKQLASAYYYKSAIYYLTSKYDSALQLSDQAIDIYKQLNDNYGVASIYNLRGLLQEKIGDYSEAIENYQKSLEFASKTDNLYGQSNPLHNIGLIYDKTQDYKTSLTYFERALVIREKIGDSVLIAQSFQSIGGAYARLGDTLQAIGFQKRAIVFFKAKENWYDLALSYTNLGEIYTVLSRYDSAELLLKEALRLNMQIDNAEGQVKALINISSVYLNKKDYSRATTFANQAIALAREYKLRPELKLAYLNSIESYEGLSNFKAAFEAQKQLILLSNSLLNAEKVEQLAQLETRYQVKEKEQRISVQQVQLERTYLIICALVIIVGLLVVIFLLARSRFRRKQQLAEHSKQLAVREAFIDATIRSQENERKRFAQDLHDGMGQLISSLRLMVNQLDKNTSVEEKISIAERSEIILNDMHTEIRSIAFNLMPQTLIQHGLLPALQEMALRVNQTGKIVISVHGYDIPERLHEVHEISLYRIIQEWTNNVIKYAHASKIDVQLIGYEEEISITVEDNGTGFDPAMLELSNGNGWKNIKSRVNLVKGEVEVDSTPQRKGTTLMLRIPVPTSTVAVGNTIVN